jgi:hypothetical protein
MSLVSSKLISLAFKKMMKKTSTLTMENLKKARMRKRKEKMLTINLRG